MFRTTLFIYLPVVVLILLLHRLIFGASMGVGWGLIVFYWILFAVWMKARYSRKMQHEDVSGLDKVESLLDADRWKITEREADLIHLKPEFDRLFSLSMDDQVVIYYSEDKVRIEGPAYYLRRLSDDIRGISGKQGQKVRTVLTVLVIAGVSLIPLLSQSRLLWELQVFAHNIQASSSSGNNLAEPGQRGSSVANTLNGGYGVVDDASLYLIEWQNRVLEIDLDTEEETVILDRASAEPWLGNLNLIGDWLYYSDNDSLHRVRTDGSSEETLYDLGQMSAVQIVDETIYFINDQDDYNPYRMTLDGSNVERIIDVSLTSMTVYEDQILFSHESGREGRMERMQPDGSGRETLLIEEASSITIWEDYYYYIGQESRLYRMDQSGTTEPELVVDYPVSLYTLTDQGIYFAAEFDLGQSQDNGMYMSELDGSDVQQVALGQLTDRLITTEEAIFYNTGQESFHNFEIIDLGDNQK